MPSNGSVGHGGVGLPLGHAVSRLGGYDMHECRYTARRYAVVGHVALWFSVVRHSAVGCRYILCC